MMTDNHGRRLPTDNNGQPLTREPWSRRAIDKLLEAETARADTWHRAYAETSKELQVLRDYVLNTTLKLARLEAEVSGDFQCKDRFLNRGGTSHCLREEGHEDEYGTGGHIFDLDTFREGSIKVYV